MKILFMGRKKYAARMLAWTVEQGHEVLAAVTDSHVHPSPATRMAESLGIPLLSYEQAAGLVRASAPDLIVSYLYWQRIKEPLISAPRHGCINFHPAILPDWKGVGGYNMAILHKLSEWGATAHLVDAGIDTGPIIKTFTFSFDYRMETAKSLAEKTQEVQCGLYKSVLTDLAEHGGFPEPFKDNAGGTYVSRKEMLAMMKIHPGDDVDLKCRAFWFPPYGGAYVELDGKKYTLANDFILKSLWEDESAL